jgi:DNA-binding YbaB/EbfC family protein
LVLGQTCQVVLKSGFTDYFIEEIHMAKGFNRGPAMGGGNPMMAQLQKLQAQMALAQEQLALEDVSATAGGGAIKVTMSGDQKCKAVEIDPDFLKDTDAEMLSDMVLTAVNLALDKSRELQEKTMGPLAGGLPF